MADDIPIRTVWRRISDMYVECGYPIREDVKAQSDCCRSRANSATFTGKYWAYRCSQHEGLVRGNEEGESKKMVEVQWKDWMENPNIYYAETEDGEVTAHGSFTNLLGL